MVPHFVFLPRILLPFTWYSWSLPTTAKGIISCRVHTCKQRQTHMNAQESFKCEQRFVFSSRFGYFPFEQDADSDNHVSWNKTTKVWIQSCEGLNLWPHPDLVVDQPVLRVLVKLFLRVNVDAVGSQLFPDLHKAPSTVTHGTNITSNWPIINANSCGYKEAETFR